MITDENEKMQIRKRALELALRYDEGKSKMRFWEQVDRYNDWMLHGRQALVMRGEMKGKGELLKKDDEEKKKEKPVSKTGSPESYEELESGRRVRSKETNPNNEKSRFNEFLIENVLDKAILNPIDGLPNQGVHNVNFVNGRGKLIAILDSSRRTFFLDRMIYGELCKISHNWNANVMRIKTLLADHFDNEELKDYEVNVIDLR